MWLHSVGQGSYHENSLPISPQMRSPHRTVNLIVNQPRHHRYFHTPGTNLLKSQRILIFVNSHDFFRGQLEISLWISGFDHLPGEVPTGPGPWERRVWCCAARTTSRMGRRDDARWDPRENIAKPWKDVLGKMGYLQLWPWLPVITGDF